MQGSVVQVNLSRGGVPKHPVEERFLGPLGLDGDSHAHPRFHGGPRKAVLLIAEEAIAKMTAAGFPVFAGALGENFTTRGLDPAEWRAGQRYRVGQAVIELTTVRVPCATLDVYGPAIKTAIYDKEVKAGNPASPKWALSGFYASVVQTGIVRQNDIIALVDQVV